MEYQTGDRVRFDDNESAFTGTVKRESECSAKILVALDDDYTSDGVVSGWCDADYLTLLTATSGLVTDAVFINTGYGYEQCR